MEKHTEFAAMMSKPLTPAERILVQLTSGTANESPAGAVLMRLSVDESADLETIIQEHGALSAACEGIPTEALTPGSVKHLTIAADTAVMWLDRAEDLPESGRLLLGFLRSALAPFKGAQPSTGTNQEWQAAEERCNQFAKDLLKARLDRR